MGLRGEVYVGDPYFSLTEWRCEITKESILLSGGSSCWNYFRSPGDHEREPEQFKETSGGVSVHCQCRF